jgi:hypothetical protein
MQRLQYEQDEQDALNLQRLHAEKQQRLEKEKLEAQKRKEGEEAKKRKDEDKLDEKKKKKKLRNARTYQHINPTSWTSLPTTPHPPTTAHHCCICGTLTTILHIHVKPQTSPHYLNPTTSPNSQVTRNATFFK